MMNIDYNKKYTKEDILELKEWFAKQELPKEMQIDSSAHTTDLKKTVETLLIQAERFYENSNMYGCIYLLERIRGQLLEGNTPDENKEK